MTGGVSSTLPCLVILAVLLTEMRKLDLTLLTDLTGLKTLLGRESSMNSSGNQAICGPLLCSYFLSRSAFYILRV